FGKHRGKPLEEIPLDYLHWFYVNCENASPYLRVEIGRILREREHDQSEQPSTALTTDVASRWYLRLAVEFHPDRGGSHEAMKAVNRGREVLLEMLEGVA